MADPDAGPSGSPAPPNPPACRKCAFVFEAGMSFERCPNCGTLTQAPPEPTGRVILPRLTTLPVPGTPLGSIRKTPANATLEGFFVPPTLVEKHPPSSPPPTPTPTPTSAPEAEAEAGCVEDDLPAPVATTRPFTLPRITVEPRMVVSAPLDSGHELENSAELELPGLSEISMIAAQLGSRSEDVEVDLADIRAPTRELPTQPDAPRAQPRPQLQSRRSTVVLTPVAPEPGPLAYAGLVALGLALVASWWFYFSQAQETSLVVGTYASKMLSDPAALRERDELLAPLFDEDTLESYLAAMALAEQHDDPLGRAEAALRIHLRHGPDPVRQAQAEVWLARMTGRESYRAQRVRGLAAIARGEHRLAQSLLADADEPGAALYRGLLARETGDFAAAAEHASQAMSLRPGDQTARWLALATELAKDRRATLDPLRTAADQQPPRPALQLLLIDALIDRGRLNEARKRLEALAREPGSSDAHQARILLRHARVAVASVEASRGVFAVDEALKLAPHDPEVVHAALRVLIEADQARAQQGLTARLRDAPDDREAMLLQAELALRAGNESAATRAIEKLAAEPELHTESVFFRGRLALLANQADEAARQFLAAASADPPHVRAAIEYARLRPRESEARALLERLYDLRSRDPSEGARADLRALALARANLRVELGRREAAVEVLDGALALDPDDNAAQLRRGVLALETGRADAGRVDLLAVYERTGGFPGLIGPLSRLYIRSGELRALEAMLQPLIDSRAPDEVVLALARLRLAQEGLEAAESLTDQILLRDPNSWEGHLLKAKVLLARGEPELAQAALRLSRPRHPSADVELTAGKIAERSGRLQEALTSYRRAHQLAPTLHEAGYLYGRALLLLGRTQEAVTELTAVTRATEAFPAAFVALGQALHERGNFEEGRRQLQRAVTLAPNQGEAHYWLGRCEFDLELHAEAVLSLGRAIHSAPPGSIWLADAHLWLARASEARGDLTASRAAYQEFLRLAGSTAPARREAERALSRPARGP
jgi:tetratricopeptide (TPR) repeat protein